MKENVLYETKSNSVAEKVRDFIKRKPFIVEAMRNDIVNYTALARLIKKEVNPGSIDAIKVSIIREKEDISKEHGLQEGKILSLLRKTKVNLQDKISVIISKKELEISHITMADLGDRFVYIVDQTMKYETLFDIKNEKDIKIEKDLVALILKSPEEIEDTPGFVAFISQLLASKNINIKQFLSYYTTTTIVLELKDALMAFSLLQKYI